MALVTDKTRRAYNAYVAESIEKDIHPMSLDAFMVEFAKKEAIAAEEEKALEITPAVEAKLKELGWELTQYEKVSGREAGKTFPYAKRGKGAEATALQNTDFIRLTRKNLTEQRNRAMRLVEFYNAMLG